MKRPASGRFESVVVPAALVLLALALRMQGLGWGLPQVYEEATPLREAWDIWGWGKDRSFDWNPHFFNYPSLVIYAQFLGQAALYLGMKLSGAIHSTLDFRLHYLLDETPFLLVGRFLSAVFGVGTVWIIYRLGRRVAGPTAGFLAALLLAVNGFHILRSQMVEVDVPVTFLVVWTLYCLLRIADHPGPRTYLLAGAALGLAVSAKYTAGLLLVPLLVAHVLATRGRGSLVSAVSLRNLGVALGAAVVVLLLTSPYLLLDANTFRQHLGTERGHMDAGHFGQGDVPTWLYYLRVLGGPLIGWPGLVVSLLAFIWLGAVRREPWSLIVGSFIVAYAVTLGTWTMHADRYLLPVVPLLYLFAAAGIVEATRHLPRRMPRSARGIAAVVGLALLALPLVAFYPELRTRSRPDTRTRAREWILSHVPSGSFIVAEHYGPDLLEPEVIWSLEQDLREQLLRETRGLYAVLTLPVFQTRPEQSEAFYDPSLYESADILVTSSEVRSRYLGERARFPRQVAFYDALEERFDQVAAFDPAGGTGPAVTVYRNRRHEAPFARRPPASPPALRVAAWTGREAPFYFTLGLNHETFGFHRQAVACYDLGLACPLPPGVFSELVRAKTRCLLNLGQRREAVAFLAEADGKAPSAEERAYVRSLRERIAGAASRR